MEKHFQHRMEVSKATQVPTKRMSQSTVFDLDKLFQLSPSIAGAAGMDDNNSIGTCATGATNATMDILREVKDKEFDQIIDTNHNTVVSAITQSTNYASPQHSKEPSITLGNQSFRSGSPSLLFTHKKDIICLSSSIFCKN